MCLYTFGKNLKSEMAKSEFVPHTLASELDIGVRSIWNYQKGTQSPTLATIADISNVLSISPNQLLSGCYPDHYTEKTIALMEKLQRSEHRRILNMFIEYFVICHNSLANTDLGRRIRTVRCEHQLSVEELASLIGVSSSSIINYETNHQSPDLQNFVSLCEVLEVSAEFMLFDLLVTETGKNYQNIMNLAPGQVDLLLNILANT